MIFADLNEYNFIVDKDGILRAIDLDSSYVEGLEGLDSPIYAYYLLNNPYLAAVPEKYAVDETGYVYPNQNSDLYSYCMILLGTLSGEAMHRKEMDDYYQYLKYLREIGIHEDLLDIFYHIYTPKTNRNPRHFIEMLPDQILRKSSFKVFQKRKGL